MSEEVRSDRIEEPEKSGLLLSVESVEGERTLHAQFGDDKDTDGTDTGDSDGTDNVSDGSDAADTDGTDTLTDSDGTDTGTDADGSDATGDSDGRD